MAHEKMTWNDVEALMSDMENYEIEGEQAYQSVKFRDGLEAGPFIQGDLENDVHVILVEIEERGK